MGNLSEFTITDEIHRGIDTAVHRGYRNTDRVPVAVKLINGEYPSPLQIGRLRHEYVILRSLDLPCAVKAWDLVRAGNGLALVTEYL